MSTEKTIGFVKMRSEQAMRPKFLRALWWWWCFSNCTGYVVSMTEWVVNVVLGSVWKEVVMAFQNILSQHLFGMSKENHRKPSVRIADLWAEFLNRGHWIWSRHANHRTITFGKVMLFRSPVNINQS
jgi:hypothetical protein